MEDREIRTVSDVTSLIDKENTREFLFRGVTSIEYQLIPKVGRLTHFNNRPLSVGDERYILRLFKQQAIPYIETAPTSDWEWLALAQHHGLPTRFLDWSTNALVALFFAVEAEYTGEFSAVYCFPAPFFAKIDLHPDPFGFDETVRFIPSHQTPRIATQSGVFTIHPVPRDSFMPPDLIRLVIPNECRYTIKRSLWRLGVHYASLFPGLDGISRHIEWSRTLKH